METHNHRHIQDAVRRIERLVDCDSYYLTREDRDQICCKLKELTEFINGIYRKRVPDGD